MAYVADIGILSYEDWEERLRQEELQFKASLSYMARYCGTKLNQTREKSGFGERIGIHFGVD